MGERVMKILDEIGEPAVLEQLAEECTELAHAALKLSRKLRGESPTPASEDMIRQDIMEEMADVQVCITVLSAGVPWVDEQYIKIVMGQKLQRWQQRIREAEEAFGGTI